MGYKTNIVFSTPADPTGTTSSSGVMMGLAIAFTPKYSGTVCVMLTGTTANDTIAKGTKINIRYGTGTATTNGASLTGTQLSGTYTYITNEPAANYQFPYGLAGIITGLNIGTAYWFDIELTQFGGGGTASVFNTNFSIEEL